MSKTITNAAIETEADTPAAVEPDTSEEMPPEIDPIEEQFTGDCPSVSGRSILTYAIGRHPETGELHLRITGNSGKGMWFDGWASAKDIDTIVKGATEADGQVVSRAASRQVHQYRWLCPGCVSRSGADSTGTGKHPPSRARPCNHVRKGGHGAYGQSRRNASQACKAQRQGGLIPWNRFLPP